MTMDLLRKIAASRLPLTFHSPEDIASIRLLRAAGCVIALIPAPSEPATLSGTPTAAQVLAITEKGLDERAKFDYPEEREPKRRAGKTWFRDWRGSRSPEARRHS